MTDSEHHITDEDLVLESLTNLESFGTLIHRYEKKLLFYILRISHVSVEEGENILQEIFLKAWKNLRDFDKSLTFSSWIYRIAHNETISQYRKDKSRGHLNKQSLDQVFDLSSDELTLEEQTDHQLRAEQFASILNRLSSDYREVLVLRYYEDKSYTEISDILKKPIGTIGTLINRAKQAFKTELQKTPHH